MKEINHKAGQRRSFRRWVRQMFSSLVKRQKRNHREELQKVKQMLREIEDSIEIIAREIARQAKRNE